MFHLAYIGIGSNLGDRQANCLGAIDALDRSAGVKVSARSRLYLTEPVGYAEQDWFANAAVQVQTDLGPDQLLALLQTLQREAGRTEGGPRNGPRVLDLDLLFFDSLVATAPDLEIPHPRLHQRRFVLQPLCDIDPEFIHPVYGLSLSRLLEGLDRQGQKVIDACAC